MSAAAAPAAVARPRSPLRAVALPTEHGGWGLTAEPVVLGLLVAPSVAGLCLGLAAVVAFVARTPLKVVLVDRHRDRHLDRTALAGRVLAVELAVIVALVAIAAWTAASASWWWPVLVAAPLVALELRFDMRSRSRRLVPELAGTVGIGSVAAMIVLAAGHEPTEAVAVWLVLAGRAVTAIPHVRSQVGRLHDHPVAAGPLVVADLAAVAVVAAAVLVDPAVWPGAVVVLLAIAVQRTLDRRATRATVIGIRQTVLGLAVVVATALGTHLA